MQFIPDLASGDLAVPLAHGETYEVYQTRFGRRLVAKKLDKRIIEVLQREKITDLAMSSLGSREVVDLNVLRLFPELKSFTLVEPNPLDWTPLQQLKEIQSLTLLTRGHKPQPLDFTSFPQLHTARITWYSEWASVLSCSTLQGLTIANSGKMQEFDVRKLPLLKELCFKECLGLTRAICSREQSLESLGIYYCRSFESIDPSQALNSLKFAEFSGNSRFDYQSLGKCAELKRLILLGVGKIRGIKFLSRCPDLETFSMRLSTQVEDGDLSALCELPKLSAIAFKRYKNYSHTLDQIKQMIKERIET